MKTFSPGNMDICEQCDNLRCYQDDEHGDIYYCKLGQKIDSTQCEPFLIYRRALEVAQAVGRALDIIPTELEDDAIYEKGRLTDRVSDALADYFQTVWDADLDYELRMPGVSAMRGVLK